jgi:hypothetical protein
MGLSKTFWYIALGVAAGIVLNSTIAGFVNPLITPLKLSVSVSG